MDIVEIAGFVLALLTFAFGMWKWTESRIDAARTEATTKAGAAQAAADLVRAELNAHKLHVAETYVTKQGLSETAEQIMVAIDGVKRAVDGMTLRVDRIVENQPRPRTRQT